MNNNQQHEMFAQMKQKEQMMMQQEVMKSAGKMTEAQKALIIKILKALKGIERILQELIKD